MTNEEFVDLLNRHPQPCATTLGQTLITVDQEVGRALSTFVAKPEFCHSKIIVQGGFLTGMVDTVMTQALFAIMGLDFVVPTLELKVSFLAPANPGILRGEGEVLRHGKHTAFLEGTLFNEGGAKLVRASATVRIFPKPPRN